MEIVRHANVAEFWAAAGKLYEADPSGTPWR